MPNSYSLTIQEIPLEEGSATTQEKSEARGRVVEVGNWTKGVNFHLEPDPGCTNGCIEKSTGNICLGLG